MALVTVVKFILGFFFAYVFFIILTPLIKATRYDTGQWANMPTNILVFGDNVYSIWILFSLLIGGVLILTVYREAERRAQQSP